MQELDDLEPAAKAVNQQLFVARANDDAEINAALASFVQQRVGALLVTAAPFFDTRRSNYRLRGAKSPARHLSVS